MAEPFIVSLTDTTAGALDALAARTERSRAWLVSRAIEDFIALNPWQIEKIEAGLAAADHDDFATDPEVATVRKRFTLEA